MGNDETTYRACVCVCVHACVGVCEHACVGLCVHACVDAHTILKRRPYVLMFYRRAAGCI